MNVIALVAMADRIAAQVSREAAAWRPHLVSIPAGMPIPVQWVAIGRSALLVSLVEALRLRTLAPYRTTRSGEAVPIVNERNGEPAQAIIELRHTGPDDESAAIDYEVRFVGSSGVAR